MAILDDGPAYAALYPRVSTGRQKDNWSVQDQLGLAHLGKERGLRVVLYDKDLGISGETIEERIDMPALLRDLAAGHTSKTVDVDDRPVVGGRLVAIICVDTDRLSRDQDVIDGLRIKKACKDAEALILTPGKVYDFANESDDLLMSFEMVLSGNRKQKIVKAVSRGLYKKAHAGGWPGGATPYGYQLVRDVPHPDGRFRGRLVIDPAEALVVREMYDLYVNGLTLPDGTWRPLTISGVAAVLNERGYLLPGRTRRKEQAPGPRRFEAADVRRHLSCRLFAGYRAWGGGPKARAHNNPYVRDLGPAEVYDEAVRILDPGLWLEAQRQRATRAVAPRRLAAVVRSLLGLLRCPRCGGHMHAKVMRQKEAGSGGEKRAVLFYECLNYRRNGATEGRGCSEGGFSVTDRMAREAVNDFLREQFTRVDLDAVLAQAEREASEDGQADARRDIQRGLDQTRVELQNLVAAVKGGGLRLEDIRDERQRLGAKEARLLGRLVRLEAGDGAKAEVAQLARALHGRTMEGVVALGQHDPARYRRFVGWFFASVVLDGSGRGRGRAVWVASVEPTEAGALFLGLPLMGAPQNQTPQEWDSGGAPWLAPLTLLLPAGATVS